MFCQKSYSEGSKYISYQYNKKTRQYFKDIEAWERKDSSKVELYFVYSKVLNSVQAKGICFANVTLECPALKEIPKYLIAD